MIAPSFLEGVGVALAASVLGGVAYSVMPLILPAASLLPLIIECLSLAYIVYLLNRSRQKMGRLTTLAVWLAIMAILWLISSSLFLIIFINLVAIWLVRSCYFHNGLSASLLDLILNGFAVLAGSWVVMQSGSLFLGLWCFFLVQALFVAIPGISRSGQTRLDSNDERFQRAQRNAQAALQRLSSHP